MRVLVANELRSYREVLAMAFQGLRPHIETHAVEPRDLNGGVRLLHPDLVICDRLTAAVEEGARFWIEYCLENDALVVTATNVDGVVPRAEDFDLDCLLSLLDSIQELISSDIRERNGPLEEAHFHEKRGGG